MTLLFALAILAYAAVFLGYAAWRKLRVVLDPGDVFPLEEAIPFAIVALGVAGILLSLMTLTWMLKLW